MPIAANEQVQLDSLEANIGLSAVGASSTGSALSHLLETDVFDKSLVAAANLTNLIELASSNQLCVAFYFFCFPFLNVNNRNLYIKNEELVQR